ncbi:hypothetical protein WHR41_05276 [Cladosporium halotolerans]|uniref:SIS domain-containing protein n=1 Tax=Cladosporium halotolerans TaxID=1052096 RepID=A0AB34KN21_9PEZI
MTSCMSAKRLSREALEEMPEEIPVMSTLTSPRPTKRRRTASLDADLLTPPHEDEDPPCAESPTKTDQIDILSYAANVLATEAAALASVTKLYQTDATAKESFTAAIDTITQSQEDRGKLIITGVGKSAYICQKLVATCKSLGVAASFMHACEAAHGDLGDIRQNDIILFISFSGKTPELLNLLPHIPATTPIIAMSSHLSPSKCPLLVDRSPSTGILLPAPIPASEEASFGVSAPTISTTVALAVSDMLALTVAEQMHRSGKREVFKRNHPGGAIGMSHRELEVVKKADVNVEAIELPSPSISANDER